MPATQVEDLKRLVEKLIAFFVFGYVEWASWLKKTHLKAARHPSQTLYYFRLSKGSIARPDN